jgi:DNA-binding LacI/PurR family transcriptional regulator
VAAGHLAGRLLIDAGITEAIHLVGDRTLLPYGPGRDRKTGLLQSLNAAGITLTGTIDCAWEPEAAYDAIKAALRSGIRPASLVCMNDRIAFGTYQALTEAGQRIPEDVSVLAFEGSHSPPGSNQPAPPSTGTCTPCAGARPNPSSRLTRHKAVIMCQRCCARDSMIKAKQSAAP